MSVPQPPNALEGHCAAINDDILYVLSPSGLQSLPLKKNATWSSEPGGQAVTGPACVVANNQGALYVIGGASSDSSFGGLQRFFFGNKTWETLSTPTNNLQARTNHSAAFLEDSQSILVYAGSQPDAPSFLSSQTFLVETQSPFNIESFTSNAPPANQPILEPWNTSHAVMVGGSDFNIEVFTFGPPEGWEQVGTNISSPLDLTARGILIDGSDGSKVLQIINADQSPNNVTQLVLLGANGKTATDGETVGSESSSTTSRKRKRDLTLQNWPSYNSTGAPTAVRTDYAVTQGLNGLVVISGGNAGSPVSLFDSTTGSWVDADKFFDSTQQPLQPTSTSSSTTSSTSTTSSASSSSSSSPNTSGGLSPHQQTLRTLGITLGVLFGIAAVFILMLLLFRWRRLKRRKQEGYIDEKTGNRMSFADRGASFMKEAGGSVNGLAPPRQSRFTMNGASRNSFAIIAGKLKRNTNHHQPKGSFESTTHLVKDKNGTMVRSEPMEMMDIGEKRPPVTRKPIPKTEQLPPTTSMYESEKELAKTPDDRKRSSGWSKYFATSVPTGPNGLSHLPAAYIKPHTTSTYTDSSEYSDGRLGSHPSHIPSSALVPPLDIDFSRTLDGQRLSHVASGSPSFSDSREDLARRGSAVAVEGQRGLIVNERPESRDRGSQISGYSLSTNNRTTLSSAITSEFYNESGNTPWTPTSTSFKDHVNNTDRASSVYTNSVYETRDRVPSRGKSAGFFPGAGTSFRPPRSRGMTANAAPTADWASPKGGAGLSTLKPSAAADDRESTLTVFPRGVPSVTPAPNVPTTSTSASPKAGPGLTAAPPKPVASVEERDSTMTVFPRGVPSSSAAATARAPSGWAASKDGTTLAIPKPGAVTDERQSTLTIFPKGVPSAYYDDREKAKQQESARANLNGTQKIQGPQTSDQKIMMSDMSWLNLGLANNQNKI